MICVRPMLNVFNHLRSPSFAIMARNFSQTLPILGSTKNSAYFKALLNLTPHPTENAHFNNEPKYQSKLSVTAPQNNRVLPLAECYHFLFDKNHFAPWHRLKASDKVWIHQQGGSLFIYSIDEKNQKLVTERLDPGGVIKTDAGVWFASEPTPDAEFCLFLELICPGFHDDDCEFAQGSDLLSLLNDANERKFASKFFNN